jgi:hypothetical protein
MDSFHKNSEIVAFVTQLSYIMLRKGDRIFGIDLLPNFFYFYAL